MATAGQSGSKGETVGVGYEREVVRHPHGSQRYVCKLKDVVIPDVWKLIMSLNSDPNYGLAVGRAVHELWALAHDLKVNLAGDTGTRGVPPGPEGKEEGA